MEKWPDVADELALEGSSDVEASTTKTPTGNGTPIRQQSTINRIVRSTVVGNRIKQLHDFTCQICGTRLETPAGAYAEICHIKPFGRPHNGPDVSENILCFCPNCHVLLDEYSLWIADDHKLVGRDGLLRGDPKHAISSEFLQYHRRMCGR